MMRQRCEHLLRSCLFTPSPCHGLLAVLHHQVVSGVHFSVADIPSNAGPVEDSSTLTVVVRRKITLFPLREAGARKYRLFTTACGPQPHWKGFCQRRAFKRMRTAMHFAVTKLASVFRMYRHRHVLDELRAKRLALLTASTITLQAFMRMKIHRLNFIDYRGAAVLIQCCYRTFLARRELSVIVHRRAMVLDERADAGTDESMVTVGCNTIPRALVRRCMRYAPAPGCCSA